MVKEAKHWREQSDLQMVAFATAKESQMGEAGKFDNFVQETFDINFWLKSPTSMTTAAFRFYSNKKTDKQRQLFQ